MSRQQLWRQGAKCLCEALVRLYLCSTPRSVVLCSSKVTTRVLVQGQGGAGANSVQGERPLRERRHESVNSHVLPRQPKQKLAMVQVDIIMRGVYPALQRGASACQSVHPIRNGVKGRCARLDTRRTCTVKLSAGVFMDLPTASWWAHGTLQHDHF